MDKSYYVVKLGTRYIKSEAQIDYGDLNLVGDWRKASMFGEYDRAEKLAETVGGNVCLIASPRPFDITKDRFLNLQKSGEANG